MMNNKNIYLVSSSESEDMTSTFSTDLQSFPGLRSEDSSGEVKTPVTPGEIFLVGGRWHNIE